MIELFPRLLVEYVGGDEAVNMLHDHHVEGMTYQQLELKYDMPHSSIHRRVARARVRLRRFGIMPQAWERTQAETPCGAA